MKLLFALKISDFGQSILIFLLVSLTFAFVVLGCDQSSNRKFDSKEWKANEKSRFSMLDDIVNNKIFIGKSKKDLLKNLGEPFIKEDNYYTGRAMQFRTSEKDGEYLHWYLFVEF